MKVLQIIADGNPGGGTTFILELIQTLENPTLLIQKNSYGFEKAGDIPKYGINFFSSRLDPRIPIKMQKLIDQVKPDLIHVHGGRAAFFLSFCRKVCPVLYTVHGLHGIHQGLRFSRWGERKAMKGADLVNFVSHAEEELALKYNLLRGTNHCVIPHGIDGKNFPRKTKTIPKLIGFIGRLSLEKDPLFLLEIMEILGPKGYRLRVIGGGEYEEEIRENPYTHVTGRVSREEGLTLLSEVEVVVVPSRWEAFGLIILEAMALEVPIIAARIPPFEDILGGGTFATLIDEKDPKKYAATIEKGIDNTAAAKEHLLENFSWDHCLGSYLSIFSELKEKSCYSLVN